MSFQDFFILFPFGSLCYSFGRYFGHFFDKKKNIQIEEKIVEINTKESPYRIPSKSDEEVLELPALSKLPPIPTHKTNNFYCPIKVGIERVRCPFCSHCYALNAPQMCSGNMCHESLRNRDIIHYHQKCSHCDSKWLRLRSTYDEVYV